ncbi:beta-ketoacyl reductase [Streptomyces sp. NBC_01275]|uniref:acyl carrier protein n=1 Tax=Streptomyces sp. NBC_01275 TaxID=2903807 RepID=UPI00338F193C
MTGDLTEADVRRLERSGARALSDEEGLALFDGALAGGEHDGLLVPIRLDLAALRRGVEGVPGVLRGLVPVRARRQAVAGVGEGEGGGLAGRLAAMGEEQRSAHLLELVRTEVAGVLGHGSPALIEPGHAFKELGFDSLTAVELRNRLNAVTGLKLGATLVFDYPTAGELAQHLRMRIPGLEAPSLSGVLDELDRIERTLTEVDATDEENVDIQRRLSALLARFEERARSTEADGVADQLDSATDDEIFAFIDNELG